MVALNFVPFMKINVKIFNLFDRDLLNSIHFSQVKYRSMFLNEEGRLLEDICIRSWLQSESALEPLVLGFTK